MIRNIVSVDLGQQFDFTAISVTQTREQWTTGPNIPAEWKATSGDRLLTYYYYLRYLERMKMKYPDVVREVKKIVTALENDQTTALLVDATGVGLPVVEMMREDLLLPIPIIITGGNSISEQNGGFHIPKRFLVAALQGLFETGRLKIASGIGCLAEFMHEIENFRVKITQSGNDTYEAWRESDHDDLVISVAMGAWYAQRESINNILIRKNDKEVLDEYDPLDRL
ncbi:phage terminase large subunit family protein [Sediminispirochaeta smaragdinae]|uniref:Terminase large subunit gp17-like C-terminal domain-containing protein n=1 Tax=Sediminispirochaeta smaragdinae (strain DSM 11293 / JCM 15392 / SEBR 4228) TaxID=573413 RepID=E1R217_SEDSS|nr:hypothetical protein [Sediminispirochaeta smaragdinae]ADK81902.1 conserved hypothetical protein [Sediminispirochaeta smaragdinae DSM 11293]